MISSSSSTSTLVVTCCTSQTHFSRFNSYTASGRAAKRRCGMRTFWATRRLVDKKPGILPDIVRLMQALVHIAELEGDNTVHVPHSVVVVNMVFRIRQGIFDGHQRAPWLVCHLDAVPGHLRCGFMHRCHRGYRLAHIAYFVD